MLLNGWNVTEEAGVWMGQTEEDPQGNTHVLMGILRRETPQGAAQEGLFLKLVLDGEPESMLEMGGGNFEEDMDVEEFARGNPARKCVEDSMQLVVDARQARNPAG